MSDYPQTQLYINGGWREGSKERLSIINPASDEIIGTVANAGRDNLDESLAAAATGFNLWRQISAFERAKLLHNAAQLLRDRVEKIATIMTLEQGKPIAESTTETLGAADTIDRFAEEARRAYGRVIPSRSLNVRQVVVKEPVGPVAAFSPWNFPLNQAVRKVAAGLAAGCSVILKGPEETPASCAELVRAFADAGLPAGVLNLVFGVPADISDHLISHPIIRKISFTGSTPVGKQLAALAGAHMKRVTMELGGTRQQSYLTTPTSIWPSGSWPERNSAMRARSALLQPASSFRRKSMPVSLMASSRRPRRSRWATDWMLA